MPILQIPTNEIFRSRRRRIVIRQIVAVATVMVAALAFFQTWAKFQEAKEADLQRRQAEASLERSAELRRQIEEINRRLTHLSEAPGLEADQAPEVSRAIGAFDERLGRLEENVSALRGALDPTDEEALTVARLKDRVIALEKDRNEVEEQLLRQFDRFERSVQLQLEASRDSVRWLFVVLIPLVLNFLYTVWKDRREAREEEPKEK